MRHLPTMRAWLAASYESKELGIRGGKIDRIAFAARFGLRGGIFMTRHSEIRALLEEYDARAEREYYLPANRQQELDRVRAVLGAGPELYKDRITISPLALAAAAGVPESRLQDRLFAEAIAAVQAKITERVKASKIDPYFHGRVFPFSDLIPTWGARFAERAATRFKQVVWGLADCSSKHIYLSLFKGLYWIGKSDNPHCLAVVAEALEGGRVSTAGEWEDALFAYRDNLLIRIANGTASDSGVDAAIKRLRTGLDALASGGVTPGTATPLPGVKHSRRRTEHRRSVAEAPSLGNEITDYVAFAREHFEAARKAMAVDLGAGDFKLFFASIGQELSAEAELPDDPADAVRLVLERRLEALRARAWAVVEEAACMHERGRELLSKATIDCARFEAVYLGNKRLLRKGYR
jgi:hypothetical protein